MVSGNKLDVIYTFQWSFFDISIINHESTKYWKKKNRDKFMLLSISITTTKIFGGIIVQKTSFSQIIYLSMDEKKKFN